MVHLWGRAELDGVVNRIGTLGLNGPVLTATVAEPPSCKVSRASSGGAAWGGFAAPYPVGRR